MLNNYYNIYKRVCQRSNLNHWGEEHTSWRLGMDLDNFVEEEHMRVASIT
jgi:hypothetical protein